MIEVDFWDRESIKHMLFKVTDANIRWGTLYSNNLACIDAKYEVLEDMNIHNIIVD